MRALLRHLAPVLAVLLLVQWGGAAASCLSALRLDPSAVLCHAADGPPAHGSEHTGSTACAHCAPLPPAIAAAPPLLRPPVHAVEMAALPLPAARPTLPAPRQSAHQARAPPRTA